MVLQIVGYFAQGLLCLIYMPLCFQLARYTSEAASRVYADLTKDIDAGEVPDIAHAPVPAVSTVFYNLPVRKRPSSACSSPCNVDCFASPLFLVFSKNSCFIMRTLVVLFQSFLSSMPGCNVVCQSTWIGLFHIHCFASIPCEMSAGECHHETGVSMYQG